MKDIPIPVPRVYDLLFVIDESPSMADEQPALLANYARMMDVLQNIEGGLPDLQIGVVSADLARGGELEGMLYDRLGPDGIRQRSYTGSLADAFLAIADLGADGGTFSQPLEAMRLALGTPGFVREQAFLMVVFVTDQDDCSAADDAFMAGGEVFDCARHGIVCEDAPLTGAAGSYVDCEPLASSPYLFPVDDYVAFLTWIKPDPRLVIVSAIVGNPAPVVVGPGPVLEPSCTSAAGAEATPAVRLVEVIQRFRDRGTFVSICDADLSDAFTQLAELLVVVIGNPCLDGAIDMTDLAPDAPGLQVDCAVADVRFPGEKNQTATPIRRCVLGGSPLQPVADQQLPCWWVAEDLLTCPAGTNLLLDVLRDQIPLVGTHLIARCAAICPP